MLDLLDEVANESIRDVVMAGRTRILVEVCPLSCVAERTELPFAASHEVSCAKPRVPLRLFFALEIPGHQLSKRAMLLTDVQSQRNQCGIHDRSRRENNRRGRHAHHYLWLGRSCHSSARALGRPTGRGSETPPGRRLQQGLGQGESRERDNPPCCTQEFIFFGLAIFRGATIFIKVTAIARALSLSGRYAPWPQVRRTSCLPTISTDLSIPVT